MGSMRNTSQYGGQTHLAAGWPDSDEDILTEAAEAFQALATQLRGQVVPGLQSQRSMLGDVWTGDASVSGLSEASKLINGHEANADHASAIAGKLHRMADTVSRTKSRVHATAQRTQELCEAIESGPGFPEEKLAALQSQVSMGMGQNMSDVSAGTAELGDGLGVSPPEGGAPGAPGAGGGPQQEMQMLQQMASKAGQAPQQLGKAASGGGKGPMEPLQQMSSMFGKMGSGGSGKSGPSVFSKHPAAGGSGARSGAGLARGASTPGAGGGSARSPMMSNLLNKGTTASATAPAGAAGANKVPGGRAPVGAGGGGMGGSGMPAGSRGQSGSSRAAMPVPAPLEHDLTEDDVDDDW